MTWKPKHSAHAIERVRLLCAFREPLPSKLILRTTKEILDRAPDFGFNAVVPAESSISTIKLQVNAAPQQEPANQNGSLMRRFNESDVVEEVGFRDMVYGYMTTIYGRWESFMARIDEVLLPALDAAGDFVELDSVRLEYWDSFLFEGNDQSPDATQLLASLDPSIPKDVVAGSSTWHSHIGWFEKNDFGPVLINRNFDMVDTQAIDGKAQRALGVYSLAEQRAANGSLSVESVRRVLDVLHRRSLLLFGSELREDYRRKIGIDLESYK